MKMRYGPSEGIRATSRDFQLNDSNFQVVFDGAFEHTLSVLHPRCVVLFGCLDRPMVEKNQNRFRRHAFI
jgi:hypothetical protein